MANIKFPNGIEINKSLEKKHFFEHINARTIEEAILYLGTDNMDARIFAGGTDMLGMMKKGIFVPDVLVNIKTIPGLSYIREDVDCLKIGPLTSLAEIINSTIIREKYPILVEAAQSVASPHIRDVATIAGNLCQEIRCWYWRRSPLTGTTFYCLRKGGEHCYAITGENAYHAIFGENPCRCVSPSDMAPALIALKATVRIAGKGACRTVSLDDFFNADGNILQPDEIITEIDIPAVDSTTRQRFLKFRIRKTIDFAIVSVAAAITAKEEKVSDARIVLGGVAPVPYRAVLSEQALYGKTLTAELAEEAASKSVIGANPLSKNGHKVPITRALVRRAIYC